MRQIRENLEAWQVGIYLAAIAAGLVLGLSFSRSVMLEALINPALALMLFVTFLQVPLAELRAVLQNGRFLGALLVTNFVVMPLVTTGLVPRHSDFDSLAVWG